MVSSGQSYTAMTSPQSSAAAAIGQRSPWHSPVPYLFGGLAAMLGLIAFALLILACSYWKLSGYLEDRENSGDRDLEMGEAKADHEKQKIPAEYEEKVLVIMAGQLKPSCLATPIPSRASSFGSNVSSSSSACCSIEKSDGSASSSSSSSSLEEEEEELRREASG